jgi:hypothetical protein
MPSLTFLANFTLATLQNANTNKVIFAKSVVYNVQNAKIDIVQVTS